MKAGVIVDWLKAEHGLGRGHAMALVRAQPPRQAVTIHIAER